MGMGMKDARFTEYGGIRIGKDEVGKNESNPNEWKTKQVFGL
jgi:hypothetical protein